MRSYLLIFPQRTRGRNSTESARLVPLAANVETSVAMFDDIAQHMSNIHGFNSSIGTNVKLKRFNVLKGLTFNRVN